MRLAKRVLLRFLQAQDVATGLPVPALDQTTGMCGPASLRAVLLYFGVDKTEAEIAKLAGSNPDEGTPPEGLVRAAKALGFNAHTKSGATLDDIREWLGKGTPVIVDWFSVDEGHYSVVKSIEDNKVFLMDPEIGSERSLDIDTFKRVWFDFMGSSEKHEGFAERQIVVVYPRA